ncbi:MAG: single-stranded DNA-binding protein [Thermodesulfobacteriota bacterium]
MARGLNNCQFIGNLGSDPEMKYTPSGTAVCNFRIAVSESFKDRDGNQQERTEWVRIVAWSKLAEICGQYLTKGRQVFVLGKYTTRTWDDQDGNKRYMTEIVAREVLMLGGNPDGGGQGGGGSQGGAPGYGDDDIPF